MAYYTYSFLVRPDRRFPFDQAVHRLLELIKQRVTMVFTVDDFVEFRTKVARHGFELWNIERAPYGGESWKADD